MSPAEPGGVSTDIDTPTETAATPSPGAGHRPGTWPYVRIVAALFVAGLATFALLYSTQAVLPDLAAAFGLTSGASTLAVSVTTAGLGVALLVAGPISDRWGRTALIHTSLAASAVVAGLCALAPTWPALLGLRFAEGVVLAGLPAVATAYLREELHPASQARAAGLYIGGTALGGMTGRLLTGAVVDAAGWRWSLGAAALLGVVCAVAVRLLLPASRRFEPVARGEAGLWTLFRAAWSDRVLVGLYLIGGLAMGAQVATFNTIGFRLTAAPFGLSLAAVSLLFCVYPVGSVSSMVAGRLADAFGCRAVLPIGSLIAIAGLALTLSGSLPVIVVGLALVVAGFFVVHGVASAWVPVRAYAAGIATAQAASLYLFSYYLGSSVFGTLAGTAYGAFGWRGVVGENAALFVGVGVLAYFLKHSEALPARG